MHAIFSLLLPAALLLPSLVSAAGQVDDQTATERSSATTAPAIFSGRVFLPDGEPAAGAVVVTSAGGEAVTATDGSYDLEVDVPLDAERVQVTAIASGGAQYLVASTGVALLAPGRAVPVGRLILAAGTSCQPDWIPTFGGMPGVDLRVEALLVFDDGSGPALYVGGWFTTAGGVAASGIARWDGASWSALGSGMNGTVNGYLANWGCPVPPITTLPGCAGNPATLEALAPSAPLPLRVTGSAAVSGLGVVAYGASGIDGSGCGLVVPGFGELLLALAPAPKTLPSGLLAGGICDLSPLVPSLPTLSGVTAYLQGAAVDFALPQPIELTNALAVTLGP